ncbi:MAG TPA: hypothetical protein VFG79_02485 [Solirubrobacter sp.]|nr:hypothetical protein [Solirubrobacter sp.]
MRLAAITLLTTLLAAAWAAPASAERHTYTLRYGPVTMGAYNVKFPKPMVQTPGVTGDIVGMSVRLVDSRGRAVTIRDVMLHHVVFMRRRELQHRTRCEGVHQEAFYGTGEENQELRLPRGYGYPITAGDRWRMHTMLMSHSLRVRRVYVQYRVTVATGEHLTPVRPFWVRAGGCRDVTYPVVGDGGPGSTDIEDSDWQVPVTGRIVAVGGHLHGGAKDMWLSQPSCEDRKLLDTAPRYGMPDHLYYRARPILHEPGPIETRYFLSRTGIPVRRGERLHITGAYDNSMPHPRVMAIMHVYIAPGRAPKRRCAPLPADRREVVRHRRVRTEPPAIKVPINEFDADGHTRPILEPPWPVKKVADGATIHLRNFRFTPVHVQIAAGDTLNFSFDDRARHNLTFANGPRVVRGPTTNNGERWPWTFTTPGRYELFCYLHPVTMHEVVEVVPLD